MTRLWPLRWSACFVAILLLAFGLRLWDLQARSLWFDEATEYWDGKTFEIAAVKAMSTRQDPPLYSVLLRGWLSVGEDTFTLRFPSVGFSVLTVAGIMFFAYRAFGFGPGLLSGLIVSALPTEIEYAQQAEQYAPLVCLIAWSLVAVQQIVRTRKWTVYALWVAAAVAGTYMHYGAVVGMLPLMGYLILYDIKNKDPRSVLKNCLCLLAYAAGILPLVILLLPGQLPKTPGSSAFQISLAAPLVELGAFATATQHLISFLLTGWPWSNVPEWIPLMVTIVSLVSATAFTVRRPTQAGISVLGMLVTTLAFYYGMSKINLYPYGFRYAVIFTPLLVLTTAIGIFNLLRHKISLAVGFALLIVLFGSMIVDLPNRTVRDLTAEGTEWIWPETSDSGQLAQYWLTNRAPGDATYVYYGALPDFRYYAELGRREAGALPPNWYARCWAQTANFCVENDVYYGTWIRARAPAEKLDAIHQTIGTMPQRLWLIFGHVFPGEENVIVDELASEYQIVQVHKTRWESAYLLEQR